MAARTLPVIDRDNEAYWTWGSEGKLAIYRCGSCKYFVHPPLPFCPRCESRDVAPQAVSGRGRVVTFTVNHKAWVPGLAVPYVLALVAIEEQDDVRLACNIIGCPPDSVAFGMEVEVEFVQAEDIFVPLFRPVRA
ncbi:Zn-ribbon domain-containing OB-fold protein [Sphingopyxis sp. 113P3]|jgi:Predicted nucleic-acid-binding protein containing a Zn-ribbon|uniref:Zn-ribbon domain-containing OB-fold protein n=1 Tax=Sphingopyxis sp. (strain 113P3) TaxID=292913 RepID=UPI0006AD5D67|nr:OB-fold domain-containing protein [Sphingopyxis sp. 113P3]ALC12881.1 DNA-binding protein [Sphingopyxis sp. 113P3]